MRPVTLSVALLLGGLLAAFVAASPALLVAAAPAAAPPAEALAQVPRGRQSGCGSYVMSTLSTDAIDLCGATDVTVSVEPSCPVCTRFDAIIVIIDTPHHQWEIDVATAALDMLWRQARNRDQTLRVGVIQYNGTTVRTVVQPRDNNVAAARGAIRSVGTGHDPRGLFERSAAEGVKMLRQMRNDREDGEIVAGCELVMYFAYTKEYDSEKGQEMIRAGQMFHRERVKFLFGCPHRHPEECHVWEPRVPRSQRYFTRPEEVSKMAGMVSDHFREVDGEREIELRLLELEQQLPPGLAYIDGSSAEPPEIERATDAPTTTLRWSWERLRDLAPLTVTYRVSPTMAGAWPIPGLARLTDMENKLDEAPITTGPITVTDAICFPTPTPPATETPTATDVPTATAVPTETPTDVPTATQSVWTIYLPIAVHEIEECVPELVYADVALVIDLSTSMDRPTSGSRTKMSAALDAARAFVANLDLTPDARGRLDRVGIAGFNAEAWTAVPMTGDAAAIGAALDGLPARMAQGTRIDLAFQEGQRILSDSAADRPSGSRPTLIVLTDGLPNQVPFPPGGRQEDTVLAAAQAAKDAGSRVFTIGLGEPADVLHDLLRQCATTPEDFFFAPESDDLEAIYRQIAGRIDACPE